MPEFPGSITDKQADVIVAHLWRWLVDFPVTTKELGRSTVAAIICDAVHEDITLQPLHDAYGRMAGYQKAREDSHART